MWRQLRQTANIIYCEYFISLLWKDKSIWTKLFSFKLQWWNMAGALQRCKCPAKALWRLTVLRTLQNWTTAGGEKIFESEVLRFKEHNQVCFPKNQTELQCSEGPGAYIAARTATTGWETWLPWDAPECLQNHPADSSTDNSSHKHSRFKHGRILSMQAEKKFLLISKGILRDICQLAHSVLSLSIMESGTEISIKYRPAAQKCMQIPTL